MSIEHGEVFIHTEGNIIIVRSVGAFNEYGALKYTSGVKAAIKALQGQSFSILVNNLEILGGTPEAYQELESFNIWLNEQKLIGKAMVITSSTTLALIEMLSPSRAAQKTKSFDNQLDAMAWLQSLN